jgi:hypothetical protein
MMARVSGENDAFEKSFIKFVSKRLVHTSRRCVH